jgi:beta-N-acetylhexosaminidase
MNSGNSGKMFRLGFFGIGICWLLVSFWPMRASTAGIIYSKKKIEQPVEEVAEETLEDSVIEVRKDWFATLYYKDTLIPPPFKGMGTTWVDSVYRSLSMEEKIGQLLMVAAYSNKNEQHYAQIDRFVSSYKVGGLIFMQGTPYMQAHLNNRYQAKATVPLMIGFDGEWGLAMRLDSSISYPRQLMLGAVSDNDLIYQMGMDIGKQMRRLGIHVNFAPVIDVNNNPRNPVINDRSFGDDVNNVGIKGLAYLHGLQHAGVLACGKHFPGHGDTDTDSHYDLPVLKQNRQRLDTIELKPFREMIKRGLGSMMIAHLSIPALDNTPNLPSTLSPKIVDDLLRKEMGFEGLVFTDALNMKGVTKFFPSGKAEVMALLAGNDILLFPDNVDAAVKGIRDAVADGTLPEALFESKVKKVLQAKFWMGLNVPQQVDLDNLYEDITPISAQVTKNQLIQDAITFVRPGEILPLQPQFTERSVSVSIGSTQPTPFTRMLGNYDHFANLFISKDANAEAFNTLYEKAASYDRIIVNVQDMSRFMSKNFGLTTNTIRFIERLPKEKTVVILFNTPYALAKFNDKQWPGGRFQNFVIAYNEERETQELTAQALFGVNQSAGKLPVKVNGYGSADCFPIEKTGVLPPDLLGYALPEEVGMDSRVLARIDSIVQRSIADGAFPGCQVLVARNNKIVYEKAFGKHTYSTNAPVVSTTDLYDIASITKIASTLPLLMHLYGEKRMMLDAKLWQYIQMPGNNHKRNLSVRELLAHQSGLVAWIPFFRETITSEDVYNNVYSPVPWGEYQLQVARNMFMRRSYTDIIWDRILESPLSSKGYRYSDLGMYFLQRIIERRAGFRLDAAFEHMISRPMGLQHMTFTPLQKGIPLSRIVPTEQDSEFRKTLVHGFVHDQGAAMMGGVAGHAGLFSNAHDVAVIMQMYLNKGRYGVHTLFPPDVMDTFNKAYFPGNRRALGFDKPVAGGKFDGPACPEASPLSFGHQGFTGTVAWADPSNGLVFVFLSNRVNPSAENKKINSGDIRQKIQQVAYQAIVK